MGLVLGLLGVVSLPREMDKRLLCNVLISLLVHRFWPGQK